jgi:AcrR family transcriptional regulator
MEEKINRRERKKIHSKNAIMEAAIELFGEKGYKDTSIAEIMGRADLGIGTFYNYFSSKEEILKSLVFNIVERLRLFIEDNKEAGKSSADLLTETMLLTAEVLDKNRFVLPLFLSAGENKGPSAHHTGMSFKGIFDEIVRKGQENGEFRRDIPLAVITELFHSMLQAASFSSAGLSFKENISYKLEIILSGMKNR